MSDARVGPPPSAEMVALVKEAADLLEELFPAPNNLLYWSAPLTYLGGLTCADLVVRDHLAQMEKVVARLTAMAEGAFL